MTTDPPLPSLKDMPEAAVVPRVSVQWERLCWGNFLVGALLVLASLMGVWVDPSERVPLQIALWLMLVVTFVGATANTYRAARGFAGRERSILLWLDVRCARYFERSARDKSGAEQLVQELTDKGSLIAGPGHDLGFGNDPGYISCSGAYVPAPFRVESRHHAVRLGYSRYCELLHAEVTRARAYSATIAAALGGLFIAGLHVFVRLLH